MRYLFLLLMLLTNLAHGQRVYLTGVVKSPAGINVPYALVSDSLNNSAVYTDNKGYFAIQLNKPLCSLKFSHVAYAPIKQDFMLSSDTFITVTLNDIEIPEVLVQGTPLSKQAMLGVNFLEGRTIQNIPSFFGEPDLIKSMTVLPGIAGGIDLYSAVYVRGGSRDQNLFLLDGARFFTTSHAGGYLSLFNPDIISHVDIYKGIAPASFGDGISSVVDVRLSDGSDVPKLSVDIGTLRSGLLIESKGNTKVFGMLAGRFSYIDFITGSAFKEFVDVKELGDGNLDFNRFNFWDLDGKIVYKPTVRTSLSLNAHAGRDENSFFHQGGEVIEPLGNTKVKDQNGNYIDNHNLTLNLKHLFSSGLSIKNTAWFTYYNLALKSKKEYFVSLLPAAHYHYEKRTFVKDFTEKMELSKQLGNKHFVKAGFQASLFTVNPSLGEKYDEILAIDSVFGYENQTAFEGALFIDDDFEPFPNSKLKIGLRSVFLNTNDTNYLSIEPRLLFSYQLAQDWSAKMGYSRASQPFHTLVETYGYFEKESWVLANDRFKPQVANQFSCGLFGKIAGTSIEVSSEAYYKKMQNLLFLNPIAYDILDLFDFIYKNGEGRSYGGELLVQKTNGKIQWSVAYTLAWSKRKFKDINNGNWFYDAFDRRHDLNVGFHCFSGEKNSWNFNYLYQSGRPFTLPLAYVQQTPFYTGFYVTGGVNNSRMPSYKRFDISYKRKGRFLWGRESELTLSVLNVFARKNPVGMYVRDGRLFMTSLYRVMPSASLKINLLKAN